MKRNSKKNKSPNLLVAGIIVAGMLFVGIAGSITNVFGDVSVLSLFNKIGFTDIEEAYPDLGIDKVTLMKLQNPSSNFPYYKYRANIILTNFGEALEDATIVISTDNDQKTAFVKNGLYGLSLKKGESFIFKDYEVLVYKNLNYRAFDFKIDAKDAKDKDTDNNAYLVEVFEDPALYQSLEVASKAGDDFVLNYTHWRGFEESLAPMQLEVCVADLSDGEPEGFDNEILRYVEVKTGDEIYSYYKFNMEPSYVADENFVCKEANLVDEGGAFRVNIENEGIVYLRGSVAEGSYALSDLVYMPVQDAMTRSTFVEKFVEETEMDLFLDGHMYFTDVDEDSVYSPYLKTMFNNGLLRATSDFLFFPEEVVTRAELLRSVLDYADVDLLVSDGAPHFHDVQKKSDDYFFVEAMHTDGAGRGIGIYFNPDLPASSHFLKYLINDFQS